ncbi:glycoside hydrolase family 43 protein [Olivibacter ginsenosidimutans]|uniref:Glycoside hydrolase family 43 protein n=2 Tax=Olivibacter ginsenosidimutans TaxID=1176537 RepID=A0ABP9BTZ9_9SPHI
MCKGKPIVLGDPFMYTYHNKYYLTGTGPADQGFPCYVSYDMINWEYQGLLWEKKQNCWAKGAFWAPEVISYMGKFYLIYSGFSDQFKGLRLALAVSDQPEGPFTDLYAPLFDGGFGAIDGHIFVDQGQPYLFFSKNGERNGYSYGIIYGMKLNQDLSAVVTDTVKLLEASQDWERVNWAHNRCNEGPTVFKYEDTYYMTYSGNHTFEPNYGIGYATASSPLGPWTKAIENPIANKNMKMGVSGIGHNSLLATSKRNEYFIIYHTHADPKHPENQKRHSHVGKLLIDQSGKLKFIPN